IIWVSRKVLIPIRCALTGKPCAAAKNRRLLAASSLWTTFGFLRCRPACHANHAHPDRPLAQGSLDRAVLPEARLGTALSSHLRFVRLGSGISVFLRSWRITRAN